MSRHQGRLFLIEKPTFIAFQQLKHSLQLTGEDRCLLFVFFSLNSLNPNWSSFPRILSTSSLPLSSPNWEALPENTGQVLAAGKVRFVP